MLMIKTFNYFFVFKLNLRCITGVAGAGGSLFDPGGNIKTFCSFGLGATSNNIDEAYALF